MSNINLEDLASEISKELEKYSEGVTEGVKKSVDTVAKEVNQEIKNKVSFNLRTGKYVRAFRIKDSYEDQFNKRKTWYVTNGQHRLTHLLEKGHALRGGGRARAFPHIKYGEELAKKRMEKLVEEVIKNAGN